MSDWGSTNRLAARVALAEGIVLDGDLHLLTRPAYPQPGGSETPLEMLNRPDAFFALTLPEGGVALVPKAQVLEITRKWIAECATLEDHGFPQMLLISELRHQAAERIYRFAADGRVIRA